MKEFTNKFSVEGYVAFDQFHGDIVLLSDEKDARAFNGFKLPENIDNNLIEYKQELLVPHLGKKIKMTLEVIRNVD